MSAVDTAPHPPVEPGAVDCPAVAVPSPPYEIAPVVDATRGPRRDGTRRRRLVASARRHRARTAAGALIAVVMISGGVSFGAKLATPGNETAGEKSVEWLRDNHGGALVNFVENQWYTRHAPAEGGAPRPIDPPPPPATAPAGSDAPDHLPPPNPVTSPARDAVAGEGQWTPIGPTVGGVTGLYTTQLRPDAVHTSFLELAVWMDPKIVRFRLHPGVELPGGSWTTPPYVPDPGGDQLVAAFNGGFRMQDAGGGFYADGKAAPPLRNGDATLVIDQNGVADVVQWGRDRSLDSNVLSARQNLALIVDGGRPAGGLDENPGDKWGATVGNKVFVWRSGVGVTATGALVYVGGPSLSARSLADTLVRVGAVRAMELDSNHDWVSFNTYQTQTSPVTGTKLLPEMVKPGDRYLATDSRDFVAVALRPYPVVPGSSPNSAQGPGPAASPASRPPPTQKPRTKHHG